MSIANWNPTAFYLIGDEVYDGSADYYYALANNYNDPPPSANWALIPPPAGGINNITSANGSGIDAIVALPNASLSTNLLAGTGITLSPSPVNTSITISATYAPSVGSFYSTSSQNLPAATQTPITYNNTSITTGIVLVGPLPSSQIRVLTTGVYKVLFSAQLDKFGGGGTDNFQLWFRLNGNNIPFSNSEADITQQINEVMTVEILLNMNANDIIEVIGYTTVGAVSCRLLANPIDATHPVAIPSIITNIYRVL